MMNLFEMAVASFVIAFSGAAAPGPLLLTVIKESVGRDYRVGAALSAGHALAELPIVLLLAFGLVGIDPKTVLFWLGSIGGIVLIGFGILTVRSSASSVVSLNPVRASAEASWPKLVILGGIASMSNPYWTLWWLTIGVVYVVQALVLGSLGLLVFYLSHIAGDGVVFVSASVLISKAKKALGGKGYRFLLIATGLILVAIGASFVLSALRSV